MVRYLVKHMIRLNDVVLN